MECVCFGLQYVVCIHNLHDVTMFSLDKLANTASHSRFSGLFLTHTQTPKCSCISEKMCVPICSHLCCFTTGVYAPYSHLRGTQTAGGVCVPKSVHTNTLAHSDADPLFPSSFSQQAAPHLLSSSCSIMSPAVFHVCLADNES